MRKAILITIDGWGTNLVGAYGNALCRTPQLDRFAAYSMVFDRAYASSPLLNVSLQSISTGQHPSERPLDGQIELAEALQTIGKQSIFMTDDPEVAELPWVQSFNETFCFDPTSDRSESTHQECTDWTETRLATFLEAALGELTRFNEQEGSGLPDWTWLHLSGLAKTWDAPYEYRCQLCDDEDDPEPPRGIEPIALAVDAKTDPDAIFGAACGAAAQGRIIDQIWSWLEAFLNELVDRKDCLVILHGVRGYPLGEHSSVGFMSHVSYSELVHTPLIIQPGEMLIGTRVDTLVQPMSIWATAIQWLAVDDDHIQFANAEIAKRRLSTNLIAASISFHKTDRQTPPMCLIASLESTSLYVERWSAVWGKRDDPDVQQPTDSIRLYLSPDDRWQQNDVSSRAFEISESMARTRDAILRWLSEGCPSDTQPMLTDCLVQRI